MATWHWAGIVLLPILSGFMGWHLRGEPGDSPAVRIAAEKRPALPSLSAPSLMAYPDAAPVTKADEVKLGADGSISAQVGHRPLTWLLSELKRQGWEPAALCNGTTAAPDTEPDGSRLVAAISTGSEATRHETLMRARSAGAFIPDSSLRELMASGPSDRIQLLALEQYVEAHGGTPESLREALHAAAAVPSTAVRAEALHQLQMLEEEQRRSQAIEQKPQ